MKDDGKHNAILASDRTDRSGCGDTCRDEVISVAHVGCGRWGRNIVRELVLHRGVHLEAVIDPSAKARAMAQTMAPWIQCFSSIDALFSLSVDAVTIASPGPLHGVHALAALQSGAHVFVEKPMTMSVKQARELINMCSTNRRIGMVGHLMHYHPAVRRMLRMIENGDVGDPRIFTSARLCLFNSPNTDGSVLWSLAPHDVSVLQSIDPYGAISASAYYRTVGTCAYPNVVSIRGMTSTGMQTCIVVSRAHKRKLRQMAVIGSDATIEFRDSVTNPQLLLRTRKGEHCICINGGPAPLTAEIDAFVTSIRTESAPLTGFQQGLRVVQMLEGLEAPCSDCKQSSWLSAAVQ